MPGTEGGAFREGALAATTEVLLAYGLSYWALLEWEGLPVFKVTLSLVLLESPAVNLVLKMISTYFIQ